MRQIVLDTETTGLSPEQGHRIIEIGCVELVNRRLTGEVFHTYLNPEREVDKGAQRVHGISNEFLKDKPLFQEIVDDLKQFIKGAQLIIHNAPFDLGFLRHEFKRLKDKSWTDLKKHCDIIDTLSLARKKHPGQRNNLDALCKRYQINNQHRELHGALLDAEILADVYLVMTGGQSKLELETNIAVQSMQRSSNTNAEQAFSLPLQKANPQEQKAHAQLLQKMQDKYTIEPVWLKQLS